VAGANCTSSSTPAASHTPSRPGIEITARHAIEPYSQGNLDSLCGLYAAINALRLALHDDGGQTKADAKHLFGQAIAYLDRKGALAETLAHGMETRRWHALVRHLAKHAATDSLTVDLERPEFHAKPTIADIFGWIDTSLAEGKPVLVQLSHGLNHFSVVAGATSASLKLFDSDGHRFVRRASCGIKEGFHHIPPKALLRLSVRRRR